MNDSTTLWDEYYRYDGGNGVTFQEYWVGDSRATLIDDKCNCWIADSDEFDAAMSEEVSAPQRTGDEFTDRSWWYEQLCRNLLRREDLEAEFEEEFGHRNWP